MNVTILEELGTRRERGGAETQTEAGAVVLSCWSLLREGGCGCCQGLDPGR